MNNNGWRVLYSEIIFQVRIQMIFKQSIFSSIFFQHHQSKFSLLFIENLHINDSISKLIVTLWNRRKQCYMKQLVAKGERLKTFEGQKLVWKQPDFLQKMSAETLRIIFLKHFQKHLFFMIERPLETLHAPLATIWYW